MNGQPTLDRQQEVFIGQTAKGGLEGQTAKGGLRWTDSRTEAFIRQTAQKGLR